MRLELLLADHARRRPDHLAVICGATRMTYRELAGAVDRFAVGLHLLGVRAGDRVVIVLPNGVEFVIAQYAAFAVGALAVTVNPRLAAGEVAHIVADAQPTLAVYASSTRSIALPGLTASAACRGVVLGAAGEGEHAFEALASWAPIALPALDPAHDDAIILYTSGTTGRAKGAILTHSNMVVQNLDMQARIWGLDENDRFLAVTPLAHRAGVARLFNALGLGGTLVVMEKFEIDAALELIEREQITVTGFVPTVLRMLLPRLRENPARCRSLRRIIVSTEAFPIELKREVLALLPQVEFHSLFGSTEVLATNLDHAGQFSHPASVGRALPGVEVRMVDAQDHDVAMGEVGELLVRSGAPGTGATFRGYFHQPAASAHTIRDDWVYSGDMARQDAEGFLYIVDRKKDMVLSGGYNIYSKEVEQVLLGLSGVSDVAVIGVPDAVFGEAVAVVIERAPNATFTAEQVVEHARRHLAGYKKPKHVAFVDALPRNSTGKVMKNVLREQSATLFPAIQINT